MPPTPTWISGGDAVALQVLEVRDGRIAVIDHFMGKSAHAAFFAAGLPAVIPS